MPIYLRSPTVARRAFGFQGSGQLVRAVPRTRFLFFTQFILSDAAKQMVSNADLNTYTGNRGLSFKVKTVDKPKITMVSQDLNQYNKKKVIYTRAEYPEQNLRLFDTVDDSPLATWIDYFTYYFGDSRRKSAQSAYSQSPTDGLFVDDSGWGLRPLHNNTQFFERIRILAFYARTYTAFSYIHPKITAIDWQNYDYTSSDPSEISISFKYEALEYEAFGKSFQPEEFGWLDADALEYPSAITQNDRPLLPIPRIFNTNLGNEARQAERNTERLTPPGFEIEAGQRLRRFSAAPGAVLPGETPDSSIGVNPGVGTVFPGESQDNAPQTGATSVRSAEEAIRPRYEIPAEIDVISTRASQRLAQAREIAVDRGLVAPDSDSRITSVQIEGGIVTGVTINGRPTPVPLTPEEEQRVERARTWAAEANRS